MKSLWRNEEIWWRVIKKCRIEKDDIWRGEKKVWILNVVGLRGIGIEESVSNKIRSWKNYWVRIGRIEIKRRFNMYWNWENEREGKSWICEIEI